jgi:hypothetical protein
MYAQNWLLIDIIVHGSLLYVLDGQQASFKFS